MWVYVSVRSSRSRRGQRFELGGNFCLRPPQGLAFYVLAHIESFSVDEFHVGESYKGQDQIL
ncbi:hypothetical protein NB231_02980 [Nitrococcus mobilis Nb-231]|uniref:Uncharacterized protein n=1 Tax=Nitrococcus mobilis Nb-231 TaxID=314278 RepID=A4BVD7_9GAMM|nr:hypothetical protein NB231_02980 [Nitrococcus mobilis Nb-231]